MIVDMILLIWIVILHAALVKMRNQAHEDTIMLMDEIADVYKTISNIPDKKCKGKK